MAAATQRYEPVIGLEVHAQLRTRTKLFCACPTDFGQPENHHTCPVCLGHPGVLPVLNRRAVEMAVRTGLALHCDVEPRSVFARKNYFYPDLPKGYQVSQFELPVCTGGWVEVRTEAGRRRGALVRVHMEEDAGKTIHDRHRGVSRVDFNRTGVPLLEIVGEPDLHTPDEAMAWLKELRRVLRYLEVCDGNLEEGSFRCDANVSLRPAGSTTLGTRVEVKNMNSFRNVGRALAFEIARQTRALDSGDEIVMETRLFDADRGRTESMRGKEESSDYRYFPDPDLLPLVVEEAMVVAARDALPELPDQARERFSTVHGLREYDTDVLTDERALAAYFDGVVAAGADPQTASSWVQTEILGRLARDGVGIEQSKVDAASLSRLLGHLASKRITGKMAKAILEVMWDDGADPDEAVERMGTVIRDDEAIDALIAEVCAEHADQVEAWRGGKTKVFGFLMGQVMKRSRGKADPKQASERLRAWLQAG